MPQMKVREYARHRGVSHVAVLKAIKSGRLDKSVTRDGKGNPVIDSELAATEWIATTKEIFKDPPAETPVEPKRRIVERPKVPDPISFDSPTMSFAEARELREEYEARLVKLKFEEKAGTLISAEDEQAKWVTVATTVKTKVLGIPAKCRQRMPEMTHEQYLVLESIVRETLEDLSRERSE